MRKFCRIAMFILPLAIGGGSPCLAQFPDPWAVYLNGMQDFDSRYSDAENHASIANGNWFPDIWHKIIVDEDYEGARFIWNEQQISNYCSEIMNFWSSAQNGCGEENDILNSAEQLIDESELDVGDALVDAMYRLDHYDDMISWCDEMISDLEWLQDWENEEEIGISGFPQTTFSALSNSNTTRDMLDFYANQLSNWIMENTP